MLEENTQGLTEGICVKSGFENNFKALFIVVYFRTRIMGSFQCAFPNHVIIMTAGVFALSSGTRDSLPHLSCLLKKQNSKSWRQGEVGK